MEPNTKELSAFLRDSKTVGMDTYEEIVIYNLGGKIYIGTWIHGHFSVSYIAQGEEIYNEHKTYLNDKEEALKTYVIDFRMLPKRGQPFNKILFCGKDGLRKEYREGARVLETRLVPHEELKVLTGTEEDRKREKLEAEKQRIQKEIDSL